MAKRRPQPYRLDWQGNAQNTEQLNRRLQKLFSDADEMFEILFKAQQSDADAINDLSTTTVVSPTSIYPFGGPPGFPGRDGVDRETVVVTSGLNSSSAITSGAVEAVGYWSPLTDGNDPDTDFIFANGDVIMVWTPTP